MTFMWSVRILEIQFLVSYTSYKSDGSSLPSGDLHLRASGEPSYGKLLGVKNITKKPYIYGQLNV